MGKHPADEFAAMTSEIGLEDAINAHLVANHFPAIPKAWLAPAVDAVNAVAEDFPTEKIDVTFAAELSMFRPRGWVEYDGKVLADAEILVDVLKLAPFVDVVRAALQ